MDEPIIVMMSGGLDSTVLFYQLLKTHTNITPVFINYGQHTAVKEYNTIKEILPEQYVSKVKYIDIKSVYSDSTSVLIKERNLWFDNVTEKDMYVPYRNLVIFSVTVAYAQTVNIMKVYSAFINTYYAKEIDASTKFLNAINRLMKDIGGISIILPFKKMSKLDVLELGIKLSVPVGKTFSCQINSMTPCGACPNCVERIQAFKQYEKRRKDNQVFK